MWGGGSVGRQAGRQAGGWVSGDVLEGVREGLLNGEGRRSVEVGRKVRAWVGGRAVVRSVRSGRENSVRPPPPPAPSRVFQQLLDRNVTDFQPISAAWRSCDYMLGICTHTHRVCARGTHTPHHATGWIMRRMPGYMGRQKQVAKPPPPTTTPIPTHHPRWRTCSPLDPLPPSPSLLSNHPPPAPVPRS